MNENPKTKLIGSFRNAYQTIFDMCLYRELSSHKEILLVLAWGTPYSGLYGEAPPESGTFFRLQVNKRVGISKVEVYKRVEKLSFSYLIGPLIKTFRLDVPYGCISLFIKHYMKMTASRYVKGVSFLNKRYIKGVPFLPKWYIKGQRVGPRGGPSPY